MRPTKVGVVGCGFIAQQVQIPDYLENPKPECGQGLSALISRLHI